MAFVNSSVYQSFKLSGAEIRVLELQPYEDSGEIQCQFRKISLDNPKEFGGYAALSYTWGTNIFDAHIVLDSVNFPVTKTLLAALRRIQLSNSTVLIWADAVCINQADIPEKMTKFLE